MIVNLSQKIYIIFVFINISANIYNNLHSHILQTLILLIQCLQNGTLKQKVYNLFIVL